MKSFPGARRQKLPEKPCWPWQNEVSVASAHLTWGGCWQSYFWCLYFESEAGCFLFLAASERRLFSRVGEAKHERRCGPEGTGYWDAFGLVCPASNSSLNSPFRSALVLSNSRGKHQVLLEMIIVVRAVQSPAPPVRKSKCLNTNVLLMTRSEPPGPSFNTSSSSL